MLITIAIVLIVLWVIGVLASVLLYGFVHILLLVAIVMILIRIIKGQRIL